MLHHQVTDWDGAYANGVNIARGERWPEAWVAPAAAFRRTLEEDGRARLDRHYGPRPRNRYDLFLPKEAPRGLVVFIHGGFWLKLDKSYWSHLAAGPLARGFAVAMPSYTLCPEVLIGDIVEEIGAAVTALAAEVEGPLVLTGHSAGGHLASRMVTRTAPLGADVQARIAHVLSISGVHDLRPMMRTAMNTDLRLDEAQARAQSPALLEPVDGARLTAWVGGAERAEFRRQNALIANIWTGLGARTLAVEEPDRHHFDVIDGLADADHPLTRTLLAE